MQLLSLALLSGGWFLTSSEARTDVTRQLYPDEEGTWDNPRDGTRRSKTNNDVCNEADCEFNIEEEVPSESSKAISLTFVAVSAIALGATLL